MRSLAWVAEAKVVPSDLPGKMRAEAGSRKQDAGGWAGLATHAVTVQSVLVSQRARRRVPNPRKCSFGFRRARCLAYYCDCDEIHTVAASLWTIAHPNSLLTPPQSASVRDKHGRWGACEELLFAPCCDIAWPVA